MATLDELINRMYDMVQDAKGIPLAGEKCILERDQMLDLLDELRSTLPNDLQAAQDIVAKRNDLLASGKREAEAIRRKAEEDARQMVSETEIVVAARKKAKEVCRTEKARGKLRTSVRSCKICSKSRIQSGKLLQNITN